MDIKHEIRKAIDEFSEWFMLKPLLVKAGVLIFVGALLNPFVKSALEAIYL